MKREYRTNGMEWNKRKFLCEGALPIVLSDSIRPARMPLRNLFLILAIALFCLSIPHSKTSAWQVAPSPADLVLTNGRIWLGGDGSSIVEALAVRGNQIVRVGSVAEIKQLIDE